MLSKMSTIRAYSITSGGWAKKKVDAQAEEAATVAAHTMATNYQPQKKPEPEQQQQPQ